MGLIKLLLTLRSSSKRAFALITDARVPMRLKIMTIALALFIISPLNILGDIPLLGFFDDSVLIAYLLNWFVRSAGSYAPAVTDIVAG